MQKLAFRNLLALDLPESYQLILFENTFRALKVVVLKKSTLLRLYLHSIMFSSGFFLAIDYEAKATLTEFFKIFEVIHSYSIVHLMQLLS